jgi:predicted ATPase
MLTRIEVDGFKNLLGFSAEFGPFTCIAGPNAVGKSNLFDAIEFLSLLADLPVKDAAKRIRGAERGIRDLFWMDGHARVDTMSFAAELVLPTSVRDDFGNVVELRTNFVRYEVALRYLLPDELPAMEGRLTGQLRVVHESISAIPSEQWTTKLRFPQREELLTPKLVDADPEDFERPPPGGAAPRTSVSISATAQEAEWFAVRQELRSWRRIALQPDAMREVGTFDQIDEPMAPDGSGLTAAIYRLANTGTRDPDAVYAELASWLSTMTPVERLSVDRDDKNRRLTLEVVTKRDGLLPAAALSDGSLRFLAFACLALDARPGLLCIDEAENGVHPATIDDLVALLHRLASETQADVRDAGGLQQVIINTHSPNLVRSVHQHDPAELLIAKTVATQGPNDAHAWALRFCPLVGTWRDAPQSPGIGLSSITSYLGPYLAARPT